MQDVWQRWRSAEVEFYEIPEREMRETYARLAYILNTSELVESVNFVDVGCAVGDYLKLIQPQIDKEFFSIGIDPIDWPGRAVYSVFLEVAIASGQEREAELNLYGGKDLAASSLKEMAKDNVTHDPRRKDEKFYVPFVVETEKGKKQVRTMPLSRVIEEQELEDQVIHIVKIDTQGTDLDVFESLGKYLPQVLFVQLETIYSDIEGHVLYEGQTRFTEELPILEKHGFRLFNVAKFPNGPEADVLFVNEELFDRLTAGSLSE
jgi:hypothetical protein